MEPIRENNHEQFLRLFAINKPDIRAYVCRLVPTRHYAADMMQEVALVLWRRFGEFDSESGPFRGWAFGIARYAALSWLEENAPEPDLGYSQLIRELDSRGLLSETLVVMTSEFGRSSSIKSGGRNHHPPAFCATLAGAGIKVGYVHGATDAKGGTVEQNPVTVGELHATVGWAIDISPEMEIKAPNGRPFTIGDNSKPVIEVFA